jgi:hypothetical protein
LISFVFDFEIERENVPHTPDPFVEVVIDQFARDGVMFNDQELDEFECNGVEVAL